MCRINDQELIVLRDAFNYRLNFETEPRTVYNDPKNLSVILQEIDDGKIMTLHDLAGYATYVINVLHHYSKTQSRMIRETHDESEKIRYRVVRDCCNGLINQVVGLTRLRPSIVDEVKSI